MADYIYKEETTDKGMNPLTVAMLGAIAGAVGTGVAMVLSNPKNRRKVQQSMKDGQQWIDKTINGVKKNASDMQGTIADTADKMSKNANQAMNETKQMAEQRRTSTK